MKIIAVCQSGLGSSFMVQMNIEQALKEEGVNLDNIKLEHSDVGSATAESADYFFVESTLAGTLSSIPEDKIVPLKSLIDKEEIKNKINSILDKENIIHS